VTCHRDSSRLAKCGMITIKQNQEPVKSKERKDMLVPGKEKGLTPDRNINAGYLPLWKLSKMNNDELFSVTTAILRGKTPI